MGEGRLINWWGSMSPLGRTILIALAAPLLVLNAWAVFAIADYFHSLVAILAGASLIAFLLNYPVSFLTQRGVNQDRAAIVVFLLALSLVLALGVTLFPIALQQAQQLVARLPEWIDSGRQQIILLNERLDTAGSPINLDALVVQITDRLKSQIQNITREVLNVAVFTVTSLLDFLLTIVLAFYLLQHGDELWHSLIEWLPSKMRQPFSQSLRLSFQNFFLGQLILAICFGVILTLVFVLVLRVPFGLLFGLTIGTMALVPFGGTVGIWVVTLLIALRDISLALKVLGACLVVQQILENLVAPRILGSVTGLNPVWVFISILTGARIGGLFGVIVAVPIAVVMKNALLAIRSYSADRAQVADHAQVVAETVPATHTLDADTIVNSSPAEASESVKASNGEYPETGTASQRTETPLSTS